MIQCEKKNQTKRLLIYFTWESILGPGPGFFQVEEAGTEGGVARDTDALSLLDNRKTRNLLLDDLHELECFLLQRQAESGELKLFQPNMIVITHKNFKVGLKRNQTDSYFRIRIRNCHFYQT